MARRDLLAGPRDHAMKRIGIAPRCNVIAVGRVKRDDQRLLRVGSRALHWPSFQRQTIRALRAVTP